MPVFISIIPTVRCIGFCSLGEIVYVIQWFKTILGRQIQIWQPLLHGIELQSKDIIDCRCVIERIVNKLELVGLI